MAGAAEFALEGDAIWVEVAPWNAAFWTSVMVIVAEITCAMIEPATYCIDEACWVESTDDVSYGPF